MRFTVYSDGIQSVDRRCMLKSTPTRVMEIEDITDNDVMAFILYTSETEFELICSCSAAVYIGVYDLIALSIQDGHSVTKKHLISVVKQLSKMASTMYERGKFDSRIDEHIY